MELFRCSNLYKTRPRSELHDKCSRLVVDDLLFKNCLEYRLLYLKSVA
jgi:hypothetical protein